MFKATFAQKSISGWVLLDYYQRWFVHSHKKQDIFSYGYGLYEWFDLNFFNVKSLSKSLFTPFLFLTVLIALL